MSTNKQKQSHSHTHIHMQLHKVIFEGVVNAITGLSLDKLPTSTIKSLANFKDHKRQTPQWGKAKMTQAHAHTAQIQHKHTAQGHSISNQPTYAPHLSNLKSYKLFFNLLISV